MAHPVYRLKVFRGGNKEPATAMRLEDTEAHQLIHIEETDPAIISFIRHNKKVILMKLGLTQHAQALDTCLALRHLLHLVGIQNMGAMLAVYGIRSPGCQYVRISDRNHAMNDDTAILLPDGLTREERASLPLVNRHGAAVNPAGARGVLLFLRGQGQQFANGNSLHAFLAFVLQINGIVNLPNAVDQRILVNILKHITSPFSGQLGLDPTVPVYAALPGANTINGNHW
jgi:hypothetical protein